MNTPRHSAGDRVHILFHLPSPTTGISELDWLPGEILDAHVLFGRIRYVVRLDDGRRLAASSYQIRTRPPAAWTDAAMTEVLDMAS